MSLISIDLTALKAEPGVSKRVVEVYSILKAYRETAARRKWEEERRKNWDLHGDNELWTEDEKNDFKKEKQLPIVDNKCFKGVQGRCAIVTDQKPEIQFHPIGSSDLYVAELFGRAHDYVWSKNSGNDTTYDVVEEVSNSGIGFFVVRHDPNRGIFGKVLFEEEPPDDVYWDPNSRKRDLSDSDVIVAKLRTKSYLKERYPKLKDDDLWYQQELIEDQDSQKSDGVTHGDNYAYAEKKGASDDRDADSPIEEPKIWEIWAHLLKTRHEDWVIYQGPEDDHPTAKQIEVEGDAEEEAKKTKGFIAHWPRTVQKRIVRHIVGKKLIPQEDDDGNEVDQLENPLGVDSDGDPIMQVIPLRDQRTLKGMPRGRTSFARDLNKISSKALMNYIHAAAHLINSPIVRGEGMKWVGNPGTPGSEIVVPKNMPPHLIPHRLNPGSFEIARWLEIKVQADNSIMDIYDTPDVMRGKVPEGQDNMSGRLGLALQDLAGMMSKPFVRALEAALIQLAKANMALILKHWPRWMWERLIEEDEWGTWLPELDRVEQEKEKPPEEQDIEKLKIQAKWQAALDLIRPEDPNEPPGTNVLDLDIQMVAGSSMPTSRMGKLQIAIEMMQVGIYDQQAALQYIDDPHKDEIAARMKQQQEQMMQQELMQKGSR
jgi:hypothetical protein